MLRLTFSYCTASLVCRPLFFSFRSQSPTCLTASSSLVRGSPFEPAAGLPTAIACLELGLTTFGIALRRAHGARGQSIASGHAWGAAGRRRGMGVLARALPEPSAV